MEPVTIPTQAGVPLAEIRRVRVEMHDAMVELETALAAPAHGEERPWAAGVTNAVVRLREALEDHIEATEGPVGLYADITTESPRLASATQRLAAEHVELSASLDDLAGYLLREEPAPAVRESATVLLAHLARHRQRGADLIYEAYEVDIGGE